MPGCLDGRSLSWKGFSFFQEFIDSLWKINGRSFSWSLSYDRPNLPQKAVNGRSVNNQQSLIHDPLVFSVVWIVVKDRCWLCDRPTLETKEEKTFTN
jgi:hypothetical protein